MTPLKGCQALITSSALIVLLYYHSCARYFCEFTPVTTLTFCLAAERKLLARLSIKYYIEKKKTKLLVNMRFFASTLPTHMLDTLRYAPVIL